MSDRNSISIAFRKKMVFFRGAECWLAETLLLHALLAAALTDGSRSVEEISRRLNRPCDCDDRLMADLLALSDFNIVVDLDTRNLYFQAADPDCTAYASWPVLDTQEAYRLLRAGSGALGCFPGKRLPFDAFDRDSVIRYAQALYGTAEEPLRGSPDANPYAPNSP